MIQINKRIPLTKLGESPREFRDVKLVSASRQFMLIDGKFIDYKDVINVVKGKEILVLTNIEKIFIENSLALDSIRVFSFESEYPVFDDIFYNKELCKNISTLRNKISRLERFGYKKVNLIKDINSRNSDILVRKIKSKSSLDSVFFRKTKEHYQEVFKILEKRKNRAILCFDFNSMYASAMEGFFPRPDHLKYFNKEKDLAVIGAEQGIYHVALSEFAGGWLSEFHPFQHRINGSNFKYKLNSEDIINTWLTRDELIFFYKYFNSVEILEKVTAPPIKSPFYSFSRRLYKKRIHYRDNASGDISKILKLELALMHSCSLSRNMSIVGGFDSDKIKAYIEDRLQELLDPNLNEVDQVKFYASRSKDISIEIDEGGSGRVLASNPNHSGNLFSMPAYVIARAKIKLLNVLEYISSFEEWDVCYANVDSVHISVPENLVDECLSRMDRFMGDGIGELRLDACATEGYWLDVGRYWLFRNGELVKYRNKTFNFNGSYPFNGKITLRKKRVFEDYSYITRSTLRLSRSHVFDKRLIVPSVDNPDSVDYRRYMFGEICDLRVASETIYQESNLSGSIKDRALSSVLEHGKKYTRGGGGLT